MTRADLLAEQFGATSYAELVREVEGERPTPVYAPPVESPHAPHHRRMALLAEERAA